MHEPNTEQLLIYSLCSNRAEGAFPLTKNHYVGSRESRLYNIYITVRSVDQFELFEKIACFRFGLSRPSLPSHGPIIGAHRAPALTRARILLLHPVAGPGRLSTRRNPAENAQNKMRNTRTPPFWVSFGPIARAVRLVCPWTSGQNKSFSALLIQGSRLSSGIHSTTNTKHLQIVSFSSMRPGSDQRLAKNTIRIVTDHSVTFLCGQVGSECRVESIRNCEQKNNTLSEPEPTTHRTT